MKKSTAELLLKLSSDLYEKEAQDFSDTRKEVWEKEIVDIVDKIKSGSSVLDLGCGNARLLALLNSKLISQNEKLQLKTKNLNTKNYSHVLQNTRITYTGIDSSKEFIELNRKRYDNSDDKCVGVKFKVGNALTLNFKNKFDYVISIAVLHHIPSEELQLEFLKNIHQALKPNHYPQGSGGKVLISVWNRLQEKYQKYSTTEYKQRLVEEYPRQSTSISALVREIGEADLLVPWKQSGQFRYIHVFTPTELKSLAQNAGFKNIKVIASKHGQKTSIDKAFGIYLIAEK